MRACACDVPSLCAVLATLPGTSMHVFTTPLLSPCDCLQVAGHAEQLDREMHAAGLRVPPKYARTPAEAEALLEGAQPGGGPLGSSCDAPRGVARQLKYPVPAALGVPCSAPHHLWL